MRLNFKDISIKYKIIFVVISTSLIVLLLSGITFFIYDKEEFKIKTIKDLSILADVIGHNSSAAVTFNDSIAANEILNTLRFNKHIRDAEIIMPDNYILTQYNKDNSNILNEFSFIEKDSIISRESSIIVIKPIIYEEELIGNIIILSDLTEYSEKINRLIKVIGIIILSALLIAILISMQLQKIISKPIFKLLDIMLGISKNKDYSVRIKKAGNDEIGSLISGFNQMLEQIERQNVDLEYSKEKAENLAKIKEQFLANISHEIKTPMNAIIGMSYLLNDTNLNKEQKTYIKHIKNSSDSLLVLINDVLEYSKIEAGKIVVEEIEFNLHTLLIEIKEVLGIKADEKNIELVLNISGDTPKHIIGDKYRLNQILLNLIGNGIKFTETGSVTVETKMINETDKTISILFTVIDTGIGIIKSKLKTIFSSFSQASSDTTRKYGGTGLGLSISKDLVELLDGKIYVYSNSNEGSNFSFYLTFKKTNKNEDKTKSKDDSNQTPTIIDNVESINILFVEDNKLNQILTKKILNKNGFNVEITENGKTAIEFLKEKNYDLILMDLHMPEMDGFETTKYIRTKLKDNKQNIPIIALTGASMDNEREKCFLIGMNEYIAKPFDPKKLTNVIIEVLKNEKKSTSSQ